LLGESWDKVFEEVWKKPTDDTYYFKKSHAIAYAHLVIVHMNLL
jgi:DNA polymerase III alpha subunit